MSYLFENAIQITTARVINQRNKEFWNKDKRDLH